MYSRIIDRDMGYRDLISRVKELAKGSPFVEIGILATEGAAQKTDKLTLIEVAEMNEFGLGVPERSFIRAFFDEYQEEAKDVLSKLLKTLVARNIDRKQALYQFGIWLVAKCQERIRTHIPPSNSKYTEEKKGSTTPLIDKGQLWTSITFRTSDGETRAKVEGRAARDEKKEAKRPSKGLLVHADRALKATAKKAGKLAGKAKKTATKAVKRAAKGAKAIKKSWKETDRTERQSAKKFGAKPFKKG